MTIFGLTAYAHVADVQRSVDFYRRLGLELRNSHEHEGVLLWAFVTSPAENPNEAGARPMLALADEPVVAADQAVLFYCWTRDVHGLHEELENAGIAVGRVEHPFLHAVRRVQGRGSRRLRATRRAARRPCELSGNRSIEPRSRRNVR